MTEPLLAAWESFYVIVGSSSAALIGLQFVVITLGAEGGLGSEETTTSFATPTVVHFGAVLLMSGILSAPWHGTGWAVGLVALSGLIGCFYMGSVIRTARRQHDYEPVLEDVIWHWCVPMTAYAALAISGLFRHHAEDVLFAVAGVALVLLFTGIHNAWDSVVFIAMRRRRMKTENQTPAGPA